MSACPLPACRRRAAATLSLAALAAALPAGCASHRADEAPEGACVEGRAGGVAVLEDGELVLAYRYAGLRIPAIDPLYAPGGTPVTRGAAEENGEGARGSALWIAHGDVNGHDFWNDPRTRIVNGEAVLCDGGRGRARIRARNLWVAGGDVVLIEDREVDVRLESGRRVIDLDLRLSPPNVPVTLGDTRDGTLALVLHPDLAPDRGRVQNSEGAAGWDVHGRRARWLAASGEVDGRVVTVALLDHPENLRSPAWWNAREGGLVAANPFAMHGFGDAPPAAGALRLSSGETLRLRYRILLLAGRLDPSEIEGAWRDWGRR